MQVKLVTFGIARDIVKSSTFKLEVDGDTLFDVKQSLVASFPEFEKLVSLKFAVNEDYQTDDFIISPKDEIVIIPPVSGG